MKRTRIMMAVFTAFLLSTSSCNLYPDSETRVEDLDIVLTHYKQENDFSQNSTYSLFDAVVEIDDDTSNIETVPNSALILQQIDANMQALGYEKVDVSADPDIKLVATAFSTTNWYYYYYYYDYWYWWGYPCCYYYPSYPVVESYTTGTLIMQMAQMKGLAPGDTLGMVWTGIVNGLLNEDTPANEKTRIKNSIDEAFRQSPYLDVNPN